MSYVRWSSSSDVYVFPTVQNGEKIYQVWATHENNGSGEMNKACLSRLECLEHLRYLRALGLKIPERPFDRLLIEIWEEEYTEDIIDENGCLKVDFYSCKAGTPVKDVLIWFRSIGFDDVKHNYEGV